jgi:alpha-D-ribose 1-methylphosphonate 5-triphosphate synthase subunit PhnH
MPPSPVNFSQVFLKVMPFKRNTMLIMKGSDIRQRMIVASGLPGNIDCEVK